jgi:ATP-dependent helicase/nuclease subunit A
MVNINCTIITIDIMRPQMFQNLTLQQFCALDYYRNMVVTSGPGAGKTGILSRRFCFILLTDPSVSLTRILTLTFTEKAAEEMKGRIYTMISALERELETGANDNILSKIRETREQFNKNRISTIHSFCANLLRENPVESHTDPGFSILQGARQSDLIEESIESAISSIWRTNRDLLLPLLKSFGSRMDLISALNNIISHPMTFEHACETAGRLFKTEGWSDQVFRDYCRVIRNENIIPYYRGLKDIEKKRGQYEALMNMLEDWHSKKKEDQEYPGIPELFAAMRRLADDKQAHGASLSVVEGMRKISYAGLIEEYYPDIFREKSPDRIFEQEFNAFMEAARSCLEYYRNEKRKINALDFADLEKECHSFLANLALHDRAQLRRIQKSFRYIMVDEFQDTNTVQWEIIQRLCSHGGPEGTDILEPGKLFVVGDKRQAIYRFRGGDITVFETVTDKIKASNHETPEAFFWQQAEMDALLTCIDRGYPGFKNTHSGSFDALSDDDKKRMLSGNIYLSHNFRTDSRPIEFFNRTFRQIFGNKGAENPERYETAHGIITMPENKRTSKSARGSAAFYLIPPSDAKKDSAEKEASLIAEIIEGVLGRRGVENHDYLAYQDIRDKINNKQKAIGILFFRFSHIKTFEAIFREAGLNFMVHRGKGFYRCQEVMEIIQLLNYISDERQRISLLSVLRSPIFGVTDSEVFDLFYRKEATIESILESDNAYIKQAGETLRTWRFLSNRLTMAELIRTIIQDRALTAIYSLHPNGRQRAANIEKFIELARRFQSEGNGALPEFVEYCLRMADEEEEEGEASVITGEDCPITMMTVHAAKGLEFPMVIIPDLDHRPPDRLRPGLPLRLYPSEAKDPKQWNSVEGSIPLWQVEIPELGYVKKFSPLGYLLNRRNILEAAAENRRVFYVACTRAMNHLILIGSMKKKFLERDSGCLSSGDYRERATILDILDDIYEFYRNFPPEKESYYTEDGESPSVFWRDPGPRSFKGMDYRPDGFLPDNFGQYDDRIRKIDLTDPIITQPYLQISFKSLKIYKECPRKFYYNVILGIRAEEPGYYPAKEQNDNAEGGLIREDDEMDLSGNALILGLLIHSYLERHHFGEGLNNDLFENLWEKSLAFEQRIEDFDKSSLEFIREKAIVQLERTLKDDRLIKALSKTQDHPEMPFLINIAEGIDFRGVIDRVFRNSNKGCWSIIDWKSNELKEKNPKEVAEQNDYFLQLACYKYAVEHITGEKVKGLYIYFTDTGDMLESDFPLDAGDFFKGVCGKIAEYTGRRQPSMDSDCKNFDMSKCRLCGYREVFCKVG